MNVKISDRDSFQRCVSESIKNIESLYNHDGSFLMSKDTTIENKIQKYIFSNFKNETHRKIIKPMFLDAIISSEKKSAGAGEICMCITIDYLREISKVSRFLTVDEINKKIHEMEKKITI